MKKLVAFVAPLFVLAVAGCGAETRTAGDTSALMNEAHGPAVQPGVFRLYRTADHRVDPGCDIYTELKLASGVVAPAAMLKMKVEGLCEIVVRPDERAYELRVADAGCGTLVYTGERQLSDGGVATIEVIDHRARYCADAVEAPVIVKETVADAAQTLFAGR